jgi:hypothetical protein
VAYDQRLSVPGPFPDSFVVARFADFSVPFGDTIGSLLYRSDPVYFAANQTVFRFVTGHASNPHVLSLPSCLGWSQSFFDLTPYRSIGIGHQPQLSTPGARESSSYRVSFERIPFACPPAPSPARAPARSARPPRSR